MTEVNFLDQYEAATQGAAPEIVRSMRRIEQGIGRCWEVHRECRDFVDEWEKTAGYGLSTFDMMNEIIESGRLSIVELMNEDDEDVELALVAWLAFQKLGKRIEAARTQGFA